MHDPSTRRPVAALYAALVLAGMVAAQPAAASTRIAGNVWKIDREASQVTIIDAGHRVTFSYGEDTIIRRGSTNRTVDDLRRGDRIVVTLAEETPDILRARLIAIAGPPSGGHGLNLLH